MTEKKGRIFMRLEYRGTEMADGSGIEGKSSMKSGGTMEQTEVMAANIVECIAGGIFEAIVKAAPKDLSEKVVREFAAARIMEIVFRGYTDFIDDEGIDYCAVSRLTDAMWSARMEGSEDEILS